ncbi:MAG: outer membrane beta-barrel protein [Deltaproteobacteria bacterium]|nr:MAG: outer membrane beta-barrel protein [Deltaproteobacteria bacterium]
MLKRKRGSILPITVVLLLFGSYTPAFSQGNLKIGPLELHPFIKASEVFTDNIYQSEEDKESSFITTFTPGLEFRIPTRWHLLRLEYHNDLIFTSKPKQTLPNHAASANLDLNFPGGLLLKAGNQYYQSIYPALSEETGLVERSQNDLSFELGYEVTDHWVVKGGYYNTIHNYQESEIMDRMEHKGGSTFLLRILSRTSLLAEFQGGGIAYKKSTGRNSTFQNGLIGIQGEITPKTNILLKLGFHHRNYDDTELSDFSKFITSFSLLNKLSFYTTLSVTASRDVSESFWKFNNTYHTSNKAGLSINRKFLRKFSALLNSSYGLNIYHEEEEVTVGKTKLRKDMILEMEFSLLYDIQQWLKLSAGYGYRNRSSNFPLLGYSENRVSFTFAVVF